MGKIKAANERRRRRLRDAPLRFSFVLYMVVTAITATAVCAIIINGLDNTRVHLYYRYRAMAEEVLIPYGGHVEYSYTDNAECYVIYNSQGMEVGQGSIPYGEGSLTSDEGRLLIVPEYSPGDAALDYAARTVTLAGEEVHLTPIEYKLLCLLAKNVGKVLTHNFILKEVWGSALPGDTPSLRVFMATLRKKIEPVPAQPKYIQTHVGVGYRMLRIAEGEPVQKNG